MIFFQHCSKSSLTKGIRFFLKKGNKMYIDWEGRIKTIFVADNMMIYVENLKESINIRKNIPKLLSSE